MTAISRDRATPARERERILRSRHRFWHPGDLATPGSTTQHLLSGLVRDDELVRVRRGLYWRGGQSPLGTGYPPTEAIVRELAPGPGVGPAGLYAANLLHLSTQVPRRAEIAVPYRAPRDEQSIRFAARPARSGRVRAALSPAEVAFLEVLTSWDTAVELPPDRARERMLELLASGIVRPVRLARATSTEPGRTRARLRDLLLASGRPDLAARVPAPDERTAAAATAAMAGAT